MVGFYSDPIIGGVPDIFDDLCSYNFSEDLVVCWDADGIGSGGIPTGYLGLVTLDSPEQLGLTSAASVPFGGNNCPKYDDKMWQLMKPGTDSTCVQPTDFVLTFASGYFSLDVGETKSYAIACVLGSDEADLLYQVGSARMVYDFITKINNHHIDRISEEFRLGHNYPNPFNSSTVIQYELGCSSSVTLIVYDLIKRKIRTLINEHQNPGVKEAIWDGFDERGNPVSSGIYLYRLETNSYIQSKR